MTTISARGFHRHFTGNVKRRHHHHSHRSAEPEIRIEYDRGRDGIRLVLLNRGNEPCTFHVTSNAYQHKWKPLIVRVPARADRDHFVALRNNGNWYDFSAHVVGEDGYSRRFAGRVETGRHLLSDPAMGGRARGTQS